MSTYQAKIPMDVNLVIRRFHFYSMCSMFKKSIEIDFHLLLFYCHYSLKLRNFLQETINHSIDFSYFTSIIMFARKDRVLKTIWQCRNGLRFKKIVTFINSEIIGICSSVSLIGNLTKLAIGLFMLDFTVLETFKLQTNRPKTSQIKEVIWCPPKPP